MRADRPYVQGVRAERSSTPRRALPRIAALSLGVVALLACPTGVALAGSSTLRAAPTCTVTDERLDELSGLVADGARWWAVADGGREARALALDPSTCAVTDVRAVPIDPSDVEDLGIGPDGALWLADVGDNSGRRDAVAVIVLPRTGPARLHRLSYPDGPHDAEALLVTDDGVPVVVTKTSGAAGIYLPSGPLVDGDAPTPLVRAGEIVLPESGTVGGPLGSLGTRTVTGAALSPVASPPGRAVAVRTYTDAWLFRLPPDVAATADVVLRALGGAPVPVALPDEPQGEAVALTADGTLLSGTESRGGRPAAVRVLPGAVASAFAPAATPRAQPETPPSTSWTPAVSPALLGVGAVAVVLAALAAGMTLHGRRRR